MKNLRKIIAFFLLIFIAGIIVTAVSINTSLKKKTPTHTTEIKKDTLFTVKNKYKNV